MAKDSEKRIERLMAIREKEREKIGAEVSKARALLDAASKHLQEAQAEVARELRGGQVTVGAPVDPDALQMASFCLEAANLEKQHREKQLERAQSELDERTRKLLAAHQKVKQMELLAKKLKEERLEKEEKTRQREVDDLSATKESKS